MTTETKGITQGKTHSRANSLEHYHGIIQILLLLYNRLTSNLGILRGNIQNVKMVKRETNEVLIESKMKVEGR